MSGLSRYRGLVDPLRTERRVEGAVVILLLLLGLQLLWGAYRTLAPALPEPVLPTAEALTVQNLRATQVPAPEMRGEIRQRPLFWVTRRPSESAARDNANAAMAEQALADSEPGDIEGLQLAGVFGTGKSAGVIVLATEKKRKHRVMVDEEVNGWTLQSVTTTEALFSRNGQRATLALQRGNILATEPAPVAEPAAEAEKTIQQQRAGAPEQGQTPAKKTKGSRRPAAGDGDDSLTLGRGSR